MRKKIISASVAALIIIGIGYLFLFAAPAKGGEAKTFVVQSGETIEQIAANLDSQNLIRSKGAFLFLANIRNIESIPSGRYQISSRSNTQYTLQQLAYPKKESIKVTIPEGYSIAQIDKKLAEMGLIATGEFSLATIGMEGYLFPDTYFVYNFDFDVNDLVSKMKNNFENRITAEIINAAKTHNRSMKDIITMASILEKEVRTEKDFVVVSGILWKRMDSGWPLQADATLLYGKNTSIITKDDINNEGNPYNTRKHKGLPPTPINNPGLRAIRASAFPEKSQYWFYLTDENGTVYYAVSNEQHNINRAKYIK